MLELHPTPGLSGLAYIAITSMAVLFDLHGARGPGPF
ncbi:MAG: hypothetical protein ACI87O_003206 [Planctomycetota bacterium]|jgi:hypothetical protein